MVTRKLDKELLYVAGQYPVVSILGPRQSGKTTLARMAFPGYAYVNLEDPELRALARDDPKAFFRQNPPPLILDEIQRVPELCSWVQVLVDAGGGNGNFILTGSSQTGLRDTLAQSLAGRNALLSLFPFCMEELRELDVPVDRDELLVRGFFPRIHAEKQDPVRAYKNYVQTYIERDLRSYSGIKNLLAFERFLGLLAGRVGQLVNLHALASDTGVTSTTLAEWLGILEASFMIYRLKPFHENYGKRLVKSPKLYFTDVGLAASLLGIKTPAAVARDPLLGGLFENMAVMEAVKQLHNRGGDCELYFFRDQNGREVDLIVEHDRQLTPVEIKASRTWNADFAGQLAWFRKLSPRAGRGIVVYGGDKAVESDQYTAVSFQDFRLP
jgi:predicted AAA+ superfamily ATPase